MLICLSNSFKAIMCGRQCCLQQPMIIIWSDLRFSYERDRIFVEQQEPHGINCNLTLLFSLIQAQACAEAKVTLISPFVGRILDWYKKEKPEEVGTGRDDPGVKSVYRIFELYRKQGFNTQVMGASFRNVDEILALAGIDLLTISPDLMDQLKSMSGDVVKRYLDRNAKEGPCRVEPFLGPLDKSLFQYHLDEDQMASDKLDEGIQNFASDAIKLETMLCEMLTQKSLK
ncbi:hypothetical protein ACOME3_005968 [Neoechinorhynchus agilis]